jgi:biotin synthase
MKTFIRELTQNILDGGAISQDQALKLMAIDIDDRETLDVLFDSSNALREHFVGDKVDLCTILNAKSGSCSEDCKFCSQSAHYKTQSATYDLLSYEEILERALEVEKQGAHRFSLVTSGKGAGSEEEFEQLIEIYRNLRRDTRLNLCASHGIITSDQARALKEVGVTMYHHNVESSEDYYSSIVTTHGYSDRVDTIKAVAAVGLEVCSGGIFGLGETVEDRVKMAFEIKAMNIKSIPLNVLVPVPGTPMGLYPVLEPMEVLKSMAMFRFVVPDAFIRYAGGRMALKDKQALGFKAGVNAALVGDFLTTIGSNVENDKDMILCSGLKI